MTAARARPRKLQDLQAPGFAHEGAPCRLGGLAVTDKADLALKGCEVALKPGRKR
jgi:hypothetical protein